MSLKNRAVSLTLNAMAGDKERNQRGIANVEKKNLTHFTMFYLLSNKSQNIDECHQINPIAYYQLYIVRFPIFPNIN